MKIGALGRHRVTFRKRTLTSDSSIGDPKENWNDDSNDFTLSAEKVSSTSREFLEAQRRNAEMTILFKFRYDRRFAAKDFSADYRILCPSDVMASPPEFDAFNIYPPRADNKRREHLIEGREVI